LAVAKINSLQKIVLWVGNVCDDIKQNRIVSKISWIYTSKKEVHLPLAIPFIFLTISA
jgi:hypothetical protein